MLDLLKLSVTFIADTDFPTQQAVA